MAESNGHQCPECGAPRSADNTPSCGCTRRASDALRDARTAEQAAAEDFDPLRIRPYVDLDAERHTPEPPPEADATMTLRAIPAQAPDVSLFEDGAPEAGPFPDADEEEPRAPHRRRTVLLGAAGGLAVVLAAAGLASGLFAYDTPDRDRALPSEVRASVPDAPTPDSASPSPSAVTTSAAPASASPSPSKSPSPSPTSTSASPSPTASTRQPSATATTTPSSTANESGGAHESTPPVLRRGSSGDEVVELELRLTQLNLYDRKPSGHYNEGVEDAVTRYQYWRGLQVEEYGVYDLTTRASLEAATQEP